MERARDQVLLPILYSDLMNLLLNLKVSEWQYMLQRTVLPNVSPQFEFIVLDVFRETCVILSI